MNHRRRFGRNYAYAGTVEARGLGIRAMWGGDDSPPPAPVYNISQPAAPSVASSTADYVANYPQLAQLQMEWEPKIAASQKATNEQLYPQTAGLQEQIATQANEALSSDLPAWYKSKVEDNLSARLGRNLVYNPQAQEQYGLNTAAAFKDYGDYWRNLALSAAGRQPLAVPSSTITQNYTPQGVMNYNSGNYGTAAGMYNTGVGATASQYNAGLNYQPPSNPWMNMAGTITGGMLGGFAGGYGTARGQAYGASSIRYKKNVKLWA